MSNNSAIEIDDMGYFMEFVSDNGRFFCSVQIYWLCKNPISQISS